MKAKPYVHTRLLVASAVGIGAIFAFANTTLAATSSDDLDVTATVSDNCTIAAGTVDFGAYDPVNVNAATALDGTGTISVTCTSGASATITLAEGSNADVASSAAAPARRMSDGAAFLSYDLYSDAGHTLIWGGDATVDVAHTGTGTATAFTVFGQVDAGQNVPSGTYTDVVVATVTF